MTANKTSSLQFLLDLENEQQLYDLVADQFNEITGSFYAQANRTLFERLHFAPNARVLDLACGTGHIAIEIAKQVPGGKVVGVDRSEQMLARANEDARLAKVQNVEWWNRDIHHLEIKPGDFDVAISCFALSYLGSDFILPTLRQLLGDQGQVGLTTSTVSSLMNWHSYFFSILAEFSEYAEGFQIESLSPMPLNADDMEGKMRAAGFERVRVESLQIPLEFSSSEEAAHYLISSGWISSFFYRIRDKNFRKKFCDRVLEEFEKVRVDQKGLKTQIEFLVAWTEKSS